MKRSLAQREAWHHNMFLGHAKSTQRHMEDIIRAPTTSDESRALASEIAGNAAALMTSLRTRREK